MKLLLAGSVLAGFIAGPAMAGEGLVQFLGALTDTSCAVAGEDYNQIVALGEIPAAVFNAAGDKSSPVTFYIHLTDCPTTVSGIQTKFDGKSDSDNTDLLALDSGSDATGLGIGIEEADGTPVPLHTASKNVVVDNNTHAVTLQYQARYVATVASVGSGTANSVSQFSLNYN